MDWAMYNESENLKNGFMITYDWINSCPPSAASVVWVHMIPRGLFSICTVLSTKWHEKDMIIDSAM